MTARTRVFLLSPAQCAGRRSRMLVAPRATFILAQQLRSAGGAPLGDVMSFLSGLYFRGKLGYARTFARPPEPGLPGGGVLIITPHAGLQAPETPFTLADLLAAARVDVRADNARYRRPLAESASRLAAWLGGECEVVLLGSVATGKYTGVLSAIFGDRLRFPAEFVGRGDMSRGALMLRAAAAGIELDYLPLGLATRHGPRPPSLAVGRRPAMTRP